MKLINYKIEQCPICGKAHEYKLKIFDKSNSEEILVLFGGGIKNNTTEVVFDCPSKKNIFTIGVSFPENIEILGVASLDEITNENNSPSYKNVTDIELESWLGGSGT